MKKILIPLAVVASFCASQVVMADYSFEDISQPQYEWCAPQIEEMAEAGYVNGYEDGTYRPDNQVTKLEGIALFARAMGSGNKENADALAIAHTQYDSALSTCSLAWGEDELAYMLYKGAFTAADLTTYVAGDAKNQPLTRGEAAIIITKAMGGEEKATSSSAVELDYYKDAAKIPKNILQYVQYVTDEGIMNGIEYEFLYDGTVTRSQIAVMLSRAVEKCDYSFVKGSFTGYDEENDTITFVSDGNEETYDVGELKATIKGEKTHIANMPENVDALAQFSGDTLVALDALSEEADEIFEATYVSQSILGGYTQIKVKDISTGLTRTITCSDNITVNYEGSPATIKSLKSGDSLTVTVSDGKIKSIVAQEPAVEISNVTVASIEINDLNELIITVSSANDEYDGNAYVVADDVSVKKNSKSAEMSEVYVGDKVVLELEKGMVVKVTATSTTSTVTGTLVSMTIANQPTISVKTDGKTKDFAVLQDCQILVNEKEGSVYDFRVGDTLVLTVQSETVTKIKCSTSVVATSGRVDGVVTAVNSSYGFISVSTADSDVPVNVFCSDSKTKFNDETGATLSMKKISVGDYVECRGTTTNGAFVSTFVIVSSEK